jgi:hypothetical protein
MISGTTTADSSKTGAHAKGVQDNTGSRAGNHVIQHDAEAALHVLVDPANRPWFPDVEQAKQRKPGQDRDPANGHEEHRDPVTDELVPHDAAMVMHTEVIRDALAKPDTKGEGGDHADCIKPVRQLAQGKVEGDCNEGAERARRKPGQSATETEREKMAPAAEYPRVDGR